MAFHYRELGCLEKALVSSLLMIAVIIAGGSGTRLWPLSTPSFPKHLLKINGDERSLLQHTYNRAGQIADAVYVVTEAGHAHHIREQLPNLSDETCIIEPARRGTASCMVAALAKLSDRIPPNEAIAFLAADHYVRDVDGFRHSFKVAADVSEKSNRIVLVGVEPNYPATGFGYIQKDNFFDEEKYVYNVHSFKEKPDFETATAFLESGNYLWNCSYFVGSVNTFLEKMRLHNSGLLGSYEKLSKSTNEKLFQKQYMDLETAAIDYALIEKVDDLLVVPAAFDWMDLGSYSDLHKAASSDQSGNHVQGEFIELEGVENCFVQNHEKKPLAVIGLDNIAVINTPQGILVTRKDLSQQVGEVSKRFLEHQ